MRGKNPTVVMPSVGVMNAADIVSTGALSMTSQACMAASRAIVHDSIFDDFVDAVVERAENIEIAPDLDDPDIGPHVSADELKSTLKYVELAQRGRDTHHGQSNN